MLVRPPEGAAPAVICACPGVAGASVADKITDTRTKGVAKRPKDAAKGTCADNPSSLAVVSKESLGRGQRRGQREGQRRGRGGYNCSIFGTEHMQRFRPAALTFALCLPSFACVCLAAARRNKGNTVYFLSYGLLVTLYLFQTIYSLFLHRITQLPKSPST